MTLPICANRSMSGVRRTSSSDTFNVIVEAFHNISDGEVDRVEFAISVNGGGSSTTTVSERAMWQPDDTTFTDPLPGVTSGPASIWAYGVSVAMSDYATGYIEVVPTVFATSGESVILPTVTIYNDKDAADNRPTNKTIYWDWIGGSDSNNGLTLGAPVKTFQKACTEVATTNDCGGGQIYIAATGEHTLQSSNNYSFGANLHTSNQWWLTVSPDPSLDRENTIITTPSTFDGDWMLFAGTGGSTNANIKFSDVKVIPGVTFSSSSVVTWNSWLEHCLIEPSAPYNEGINGRLAISAYDYRGAPVGVNNQGPLGIRYATSCTSRHTIFPGVANWVRGWFMHEGAGPIIQINADDEVYSNILLSNLHGNDVSGYFSVQTDAMEMAPEAGAIFRLQATSNYTGSDFAIHGTALGDAQQFGVVTAGFSNAGNNATHSVVSGGYSGVWPYLAITGFGGTLVQEGEASVTMQPAAVADDQSWEVKVHSDIVQFNGNNLSNIILSNIAVYSGWQTQGIFSASHPLSGVAIFNFYDGFTEPEYSLPTRTYTVGEPTKHFLVRNATFSQVQVDGTQSNENIEWLDCAFESWGVYAGSMTTYTGQGYIDYNHFVVAGEETGTNFTTGTFFNDPSPSLNGDASPSTSSTAYGAASSLWSKPSAWNATNSKGALSNVTSADWSLIASLEVLASPLISTGTMPSSSTQSNVSPATLSSTASIPETSVGQSTPANPSDPPTIAVDPSELRSASSIVILYGENVPTIAVTSVDSIASATGGQGAPTELPTIPISVTVGVATANVSNEPVDPPRTPPSEIPVFNISVPTSTPTLETSVAIKDDEILPVIIELNKVDNNIIDVSTNSKAVWTQNVLDNIHLPGVPRTIIQINTANYGAIGKKSDGIAGKVVFNRRRF